MFTSIGPVVVAIGGRTLLLQHLSPEGLSSIVDYIQTNKKAAPAVAEVAEQITRYNLPEKVAIAAVQAAVKFDAEERLRTRFFGPESLPLGAFFEEDVCAMLLSILALPKQPDVNLDVAKELVRKEGGGIPSIAKISLAFPKNPEKKDQALSDWLMNGAGPTGHSSVPTSSEKARADGPPPS